MQLSPNFSLEELTFSNTAKAKGIPNDPSPAEVESLRALCAAVLQPLRDGLGQGIKVNSAYRGPQLNRAIGGATKSQHLVGQAADIQCPGMTVLELFKTVIRMKLPYDQLIYEVNGASQWVHVSHSAAGNKGQILHATFPAGKAVYAPLTAEQALAMTAPVSRDIGAVEESGYDETHDEPPQPPRARAARPATRKAAAKKAPAKKAPAKKAAAKKTAKR